MKVLAVLPFVPWPLNHGGRIRTFQLLRALARRHEVVVLSMARTPAERHHLAALEKQGLFVRGGLVPPEPAQLPPGRRLAKWARVLAGRSSLLPRWLHRSFIELLDDTLRKTAFDLAILETVWMSVYRSHLAGLPVVASTQNVESDVLLDCAQSFRGLSRWLASRDAALLAREESRFVATSALTLAVSDDDARRLRTLAPGARVEVVENGVDATRSTILPPADAGPLLFVASFDYPPNADGAQYLVHDLLPAIRAALGPTEVVLAGRDPGPATEALAALPGITVTGPLADLTARYREASVVVVPLRFGGGSRLKILEAMALGRPVVSTTAGAAGLAVAHERELLIADGPAAFAAAIGRLRLDAELRRGLVARARRFVEERHDWSKLGERFADLIETAPPRGVRP